MNTLVCPACGGRNIRTITGIEREYKGNMETGRIRPIIAKAVCNECGHIQTPVKVTPIGNWYYPSSI